MKIKIKYFFLVSVISSFIIFSSCKKDEETVDNDTTTATDNALAQSVFNDMVSIADEVGRTDSLNGYKLAGNNQSLLSTCANISFDTIGSSDTILVDFGSSNCLGTDGRYRKGQLVITYTGNYSDSGSVVQVKPNGYFVNNHEVMGVKTVTNKGHIGVGGSLRYDITVNATIIKANYGGTIVWNSSRTRDWISGEATSTYLDDKFSILGTASGTSAKGFNFTSTITSALIKDNSCSSNRRFFTQGTIEHQVQEKALRILDFGTGTCDNVGTVTINGTVYNVTFN